MRISLSTVAATAFLAATAIACAQAPRQDSLQDRASQPEVQRPADPSAVRAPSVAPSRETTGAAVPGEPRDPVPKGGKHEDEDQTAPTSIPAPK
jgi:hypothetical protein